MKPVALVFGCSLVITVVSFAAWLPHINVLGGDADKWGLLIPLFVVGGFMTLFTGLAMIAFGLQAAARWALRRSW
jgi:hypothetical protein